MLKVVFFYFSNRDYLKNNQKIVFGRIKKYLKIRIKTLILPTEIFIIKRTGNYGKSV
jgi:hypothetical protein